MKNKFNLSVVIASIGGDVLKRTIEILNQGSVVPDEIILVVPEVYASKIPEITCTNFRCELVNFKGQVAQRAHGFKIAKCDYVLQLDDDIELHHTCVEHLLLAIVKLGSGHSVGPSIFFLGTYQNIYSMHSGLKALFYDLKAFLLSGAPWGLKRMGRISMIGSGYGIDTAKVSEELIQTQWLAGGCVLHRKESLVIENYFPYPGKAYAEDLIHSILLTKAGIKLFAVNSATCLIEKPILNSSTYSLSGDYRIRLYINELRGVDRFRVHIWYRVRQFIQLFQHGRKNIN